MLPALDEGRADAVLCGQGIIPSRQAVAAIDGSTNMALAETFDGAITVGISGQSDDVFGEMLAAAWDKWLPTLEYPFQGSETELSE
jgi:polar amino acid transport system substrate-binding protein